MPFGDTPGLDAGFGRPDFMMPQGALITSALSNKGNPTGFGQDNTFRVLDQQEIRLVDNKGNVLFSGVGPEAARQAVAMGQGISDEKGNKAGWMIQTGDRYLNTDGTVGGTRWSDVAREKVNKSALSVVGDVLGTALPIAVGFIPGLQGVGAVLAGAGAGGAGAALRGDNILKGAVMGGLGSAGGQYLSGPLKEAGLSANAARSVGTGIGTTAGGLATGQSLKNSLIGGVTSGGLSYLGGEAFGNRGNAPASENTTGGVGSSGVELGDINVTARIPNFSGTAFNTNFFDKAQMGDQAPDRSIAEGGIGGSGVELNPSDIVVTGRGAIPNFSGTAFTPTFFDNASDFAVDTETQPAEQKTEDTATDELVVTAREPTGNLSYVPSLVDDAMQAEMAGKTTPPEKTTVEKLNEIGDYAKLAGYAIPLLGGLLGGGKGGASGVRYPGGGTGTLNPLFSAKLPEPNLPGATGNFAVRPQSDFGVTNGQPRDWTKYGFGPEASFFNYVPQRGSAPVAAPVAAPISNAPSAPAMYVPDDMRFAEGGPFAAKRTDFAVNGPGDGRSDEIPAVLSDGEYVLDAETVALLGNGSNKAGAEVLDQFRVNLRKHKGQKLAKGEFSVNAKQPEQYLAGGRI